MIIVAPVSRVDEVRSVIEAGAGEIYCGLLDRSATDGYANIGCLNRRAESSSNLLNYEELEEVVRAAHEKGVPVSFTLNEFYNQEQLIQALRQLEKVASCGVDKVIVSDIGLLCKIREAGYREPQVQISSCATVLNSETVRFYRTFNPRRIICNRQLTLSEIRSIRESFPELEMETFILNERCYNMDGLCTWLHGRFSPAYNAAIRALLDATQHSNAIEYIPRFIQQKLHRYAVRSNLSCCFPYQGTYISEADGRALPGPEKKITFNRADSFLQACGICALHDLHAMKIGFLKMSGRCLLTHKIRDIRLMKDAIAMVEGGMEKADFSRRARDLVRRTYKRACAPEYCYYHDES